jgi:hypothetical protein
LTWRILLMRSGLLASQASTGRPPQLGGLVTAASPPRDGSPSQGIKRWRHVPAENIRPRIEFWLEAVGKDTVSRVWRKVKSDWEAWNARSLVDEPIVRLILDGTVVPER